MRWRMAYLLHIVLYSGKLRRLGGDLLLQTRNVLGLQSLDQLHRRLGSTQLL